MNAYANKQTKRKRKRKRKETDACVNKMKMWFIKRNYKTKVNLTNIIIITCKLLTLWR